MHSTAAMLLSCCYLYCCLVPIQSHLITSYLQVSPHQQHMLCARMPPIGIHWHVHITTAHSNSTYTSPPPNTNTCTTLAASRDIQFHASMLACMPMTICINTVQFTSNILAYTPITTPSGALAVFNAIGGGGGSTTVVA